MGFNNSRTADGFSRGVGAVAAVATGPAIALPLSLFAAIGAQITKPVAVQFYIETLPAQPKHFRCRSAIIAGKLQGGFDAQALNGIRRIAHKVLERHAPDQFRELFN